MLTEETALKFFNSTQEAMGNSLTWREKEFKITGILKNVPENSHLQFSALSTVATLLAENKGYNDQWGGNSLNTYFVLNPNTNIAEMEAKFPAFMSRHMDDPDINTFYKLYLQPLNQVHLGSMDIEHDYNNYRKFNGSYLDVFYVIGIFILLISFNFISYMV